MTLTDEELIRLSHGEKDNRSVSLLISRYINLIKIKARKMKNDRIEEDDLISEGFLGLISAIRNYDDEKGKFNTFANICISNKMKTAAIRSNSVILSDENFQTDEIEDIGASTEERIILKEQENEISGLLAAKLSKLELKVLTMYLSAFTYSQISNKLGISVKSVDNALSRARSKLKQSFGK